VKRPSSWGKFTRNGEERRFLAGPTWRLTELRRIIRLSLGCLLVLRSRHGVGPGVTVGGAARGPFGERD